MTLEERRKKIERIILERQEMKINDLHMMFDVSSVTLRNDLIFLERQGVCRRLFGRVIAESGDVGIQLNYSYQKNLEFKERIGKYAAGLINEGEAVLFFFGTTTQQVARFVDPELKFIAITNSIHIVQELRSLNKAKILLLGGLLNAETGSTYGSDTIHQINQYKVDKLFLSVDGIDAKSGITNAMPFETDIINTIIKQSKSIIVVADHTKVGAVNFISMSEIEDIDMLITDSNANIDKINELRECGLEVVIV